MFTGLVLGTGKITTVSPGDGECRFTIAPDFALSASYVQGESIAVNGVCLSVESFTASSFTAFASRETLGLTTLHTLRRGDMVNLERALSLGDRLGGHLVSGHVDATATVEAITPAASSLCIRVSFPQEFSAQVIAKGSVALDGVSLTVNRTGPGFLEVNVIPETQKNTTIGSWKPGRTLNFETDMIAKYVENMLGAWKKGPHESRLTLDFLRDNGF